MLHRALKSYQSLGTETAVNAANPSQLILLVYDRLLDHLRQAGTMMAAGEDASRPIQKSLDLITGGLLTALDLERGGEIANNLAALYEWAVRSLLKARLRRDPAMLEDVIRVFMPLREAWAVASAQETTAA